MVNAPAENNVNAVMSTKRRAIKACRNSGMKGKAGLVFLRFDFERLMTVERDMLIPN